MQLESVAVTMHCNLKGVRRRTSRYETHYALAYKLNTSHHLRSRYGSIHQILARRDNRLLSCSKLKTEKSHHLKTA